MFGSFYLVCRLLLEKIIVVHHNDLGFGNHFDAFDLQVVDQKSFVIHLG